MLEQGDLSLTAHNNNPLKCLLTLFEIPRKKINAML